MIMNGYMEEILDCTHNGILAINTDLIITLCNKAAGHLLGIKPEDAIGKPINQCTLPRVITTGKPEYSLKVVLNGRTMVSNHTPLSVGGKMWGRWRYFRI